MTYNKLVRDKIPEIIENGGKIPICRTLTDAEYICELEKKLDEEIAEFHESKSGEELADILEVVYALSRVLCGGTGELEYLQRRKLQTNGGFEKKTYLIEVLSGD